MRNPGPLQSVRSDPGPGHAPEQRGQKESVPPGLLVDYGARRGIQDEPARVIVMVPVEVEHVVQRAGDDIGGAAPDASEVPVIFDEAEDG
jgi:hypothetical protein